MNVAENWPEMLNADLTPLSECERQAKYIASLKDQTARHRALFEIKGRHSEAVGKYIERRAREIYREGAAA